MDIVIHSLGMPFGPNTVNESSLGGSESAAFYLARGLAAKGHQVTIFNGIEGAEVDQDDGVTYVPAGTVSREHPLGEHFEYYAHHTPHDVLIIQRHPMAFHKRFNSKVNIWQLHDLALMRTQAPALAGTWQIDAVTCVSDWHRDQVNKTWLIGRDILFTVPNGVDPNLYQVTAATERFITFDGQQVVGRSDRGINLPTNKSVLLYQSRPERGLEHLVRPGGIMDRCRDLAVHLVICGYDNTTEQMAPYYNKLLKQAAALPNVSFVGALTKPQLAELQRKADLLIYPTEFEEVSCITAMEAMHAGLPILSSHVGALPETCKGAGVELIPLKAGEADEDLFVTWLTNVFGGAYKSAYPPTLDEMRTLQHARAKDLTWSNATNALEEVIQEAFRRRRGNDAAVLRTAIDRSDIDFARWFQQFLSEGGYDGRIDAIEAAAQTELRTLYQFTESDETLSRHYALHTEEYYDANEDSVVGEDVTSSMRFRGVASLVETEHNLSKHPLRVLDYGCAHGHYLVPLAKAFPQSLFAGMDVSERAIAAAERWIEKDQLKNAMVICGAEEFLSRDESKFDVIIAGEVLEHARDWKLLLKLLAARLEVGGCLIISTPHGPWERSDYKKFRTFREHLNHFEKTDIKEICDGMDLRLTYAPASFDMVGEAMGSWIWHVRPGHIAFLEPNYQRKLSTYAARETISACMIVKNGALSLRKCVESFVDWVDEIRIYIDPTTDDRTFDVAAGLAVDYPHRSFHIQTAMMSALRDGFDSARNESIKDASGNWILWVDADEEIHDPWKLQSFARPSMHNGYGFAQMHFSLDPPQVLTTDFPTRLFRNNKGIKFFGLVHEHPEEKLGDAIQTSIIRPEVKFLHCGYVDETTRRRRFERNFPLVKQDLLKHPTRKLTKFLWLRDLAQSIMFEQQQMGGQIAEEHVVKAKEAIEVFEQMIDGGPPRMIMDAMQYYSHCVLTIGGGFDSEINVKITNPGMPHMTAHYVFQGRFHNRKFYQRLIAHLLEEGTKTYEDKYL